MGPFELADYTGLDLNLLIAKGWLDYNKRGLIPDYLTGEIQLVRKMVEQGRLGRKSGRGFYEVSRLGGSKLTCSTRTAKRSRRVTSCSYMVCI